MAGKGVGRARCSRHGDAGGEAGTRAEAQDPAAHPLLAAEQVSDAGQVQEQAGRIGNGGDGGPAAGGEQGEAGQNSRLRIRFGRADIKPWHQHAGLGDGHDRLDAERLRSGAGSGDHHALSVAAGGDEGDQAFPIIVIPAKAGIQELSPARSSRVANFGRSCSWVPAFAGMTSYFGRAAYFPGNERTQRAALLPEGTFQIVRATVSGLGRDIRRHGPERVGQVLAAAAKFAHRRALVKRQLLNLLDHRVALRPFGGDLAVEPLVRTFRPMRAGPPAAGARIIHLRRGLVGALIEAHALAQGEKLGAFLGVFRPTGIRPPGGSGFLDWADIRGRLGRCSSGSRSLRSRPSTMLRMVPLPCKSRGGTRLRDARPFQPSDPVDGEVGQVERGDPGHRRPPSEVRTIRRRAGGRG